MLVSGHRLNRFARAPVGATCIGDTGFSRKVTLGMASGHSTRLLPKVALREERVLLPVLFPSRSGLRQRTAAGETPVCPALFTGPRGDEPQRVQRRALERQPSALSTCSPPRRRTPEPDSARRINHVRSVRAAGRDVLRKAAAPTAAAGSDIRWRQAGPSLSLARRYRRQRNRGSGP
jgi:hypothetical protein